MSSRIVLFHLREHFSYLRHIDRLVKSSSEKRRFYLFCSVGALGVCVNLLALSVLLHWFDMHPLASSIVASFIAC
ncbi:GtrA family protein [Alicyclobacillus ferrooxydans]|uniref:GtrA family protein n=1 Tax=Alicyclobacillus ferrooxydans TaxID=471514 RepID=UPI0012EDE66A